jgi:hypothetical protein
MFDINKKVPVTYKYDVEWLDRPDLDVQINSWIMRLASISRMEQLANQFQGGHVHRRQLAKEFHEVLHCYAFFLDERREKFKSSKVRPDIVSRLWQEGDRIDRCIATLERTYLQQFKEDLLSAEQLARLTTSVSAMNLADRLAGPNTKRCVIDKKIVLVNFWLDDLLHGNSTISVGVDEDGKTDETALFIAFLGNAVTEKARLVLDVLLKDASKLLREPSKFKTESTVGASTNSSSEWSIEEYKTTIKAEAEAFVGVKKTGKYEMECTGMKATFEGQALIGAKIAGQGEATWGRNGVEAKASIDAMVGIQIKFDANIEIGDVFLLEASAEAFAGALANASVEFSATVDGVKLAIGAEVFAGARITGSAAVGFKLGGLQILKGEVEASFTAGAGAKFKFEFESTGAGGQNLEFEAGLTLGLGAEAAAKLNFNSWNASLAASTLYYTAYTAIAYTSEDAQAWRNHFSRLESNKKLFEWTLERLEHYKQQAELEYQAAVGLEKELGRIKEIADSKWKPKKNQKIIRGRTAHKV